MKQRCVFLLFIFHLILTAAVAQNDSSKVTALNLKQCVDIAVKNNLTVKQSETSLKTSGVSFTQSKENLLPYISAYGSQGINIGRSVNPYTNQYVDENVNAGNYYVQSSLVLFNGLQLQNGIRQNRLNYDASKMDWQQQKDNITLNVILNYLQVLGSQDLLDIARRQADVDAKQVERLEIQNNEGAILPSALYDLRGQYANDKVNIVLAVNTLETAKINLFQLLNVPYDRNATYERIAVDLSVPEYGVGSDSIYQTALTLIPLIRATELRVKSFEKGVQAAKGKMYPTLSFYGSASTNYSSIATSPSGEKLDFNDQFKNNRYYSFGLQLNIPILNYGLARNNVKLARINLENARNVANASRNQLQQMVEKAYQDMISADGQYKTYQEQEEAYQSSFHAAEIRFNEGAITSVDYVIAKNNVDRASVNLTAARYNYIFRTKILDYYQGRLSW
jgi:outer membrane protein